MKMLRALILVCLFTETGDIRAKAAEKSDKVVTHTFRPDKEEMTEVQMQKVKLPKDFHLAVFAKNLGNARMMAVTDDGTVLVTRMNDGKVTALKDTNGDGVADSRADIVSDLKDVHGIAIHKAELFLATTRQLYRGPISGTGQVGKLAKIGEPLSDGGQHPRRTLGFDEKGRLYISVGSTCNNCVESNPEHATMLRSDTYGSNRTIFASGLRNTIGFAWHPTTQEMWGMDHGSDDRGDDIPPEELNHIVEGADYGWPFCYGNSIVDTQANPPKNGTKEAHCAKATRPVLTYQAHSAPIGFVFYTGSQFPADFRNDAFAVMRGSWNRKPATGYKIVHIQFKRGTPTGIEDFLTGFLSGDGKKHFGRLAGVVVAKDGSLLFTDDANGLIYRVSYAESVNK